jgi:hypothetical protein
VDVAGGDRTDGIPDIIDMGAAHHEGGVLLSVGIPEVDASCCLVASVGGKNEAIAYPDSTHAQPV